MIFLPILALFSLMITDLILGRNRIHSLSHLFSVLDSAYTLGWKVGRIAGAIARLEARIEAKRLVFLPKSADAAPY